MTSRGLGDRQRRPPFIFVSLLGLLILGTIAFRLYLPTIILNRTNHVLSKIPGYYGHIDRVGVHLWRSAYSIEGFELLKTDGDVPVPFVSVKTIDFSLAWKALFHGNLAGKVVLEEPTINFVTGGNAAQQQTSIDKSWQDRVKELFPLRIERLQMTDGEIHFRNYHTDPPIDIFLHKIFLVATNLTNSKRFTHTLKATIDAHAEAMSTGDLRMHMVVDPLGTGKTFEMQLELKHLALTELNDFFRHYLAVEMKQGTLSLYMEGAAENSKFAGYVKPLLEKPDLVKIKENASVLEALKGFVVKMIAYVLKNHPKDRLATRIEITGDLDHLQPNIWTGVASFLGNWLIKAIAPGLEGGVTLKSARKQTVPFAPKQ